MSFQKRIGFLLLSIYLILVGLFGLVPALTFNGSGTILAVLALVTGIVILIDR